MCVGDPARKSKQRLPDPRSNSGWPSVSSSLLTCWLTADCVRLTCLAAAVKLPVS
jgi:hypothetical protein